jgi:hypothetical protein
MKARNMKVEEKNEIPTQPLVHKHNTNTKTNLNNDTLKNWESLVPMSTIKFKFCISIQEIADI